MKKIIYIIIELFKHDCWLNKKIVSADYRKYGDSGMVVNLSKEYECTKCGKIWSE